MQILIDADGCPVVDSAIKIAKQSNIEVTIFCDTSHVFDREGAKTITVQKGADSVDFFLVNLVKKGDIIITQDYGLAAMALSKQGIPLSQDGLVYTNENIDSLLLGRHIAKKIRHSGGRIKGSPKRTNEQDEAFEISLLNLINKQKEV